MAGSKRKQKLFGQVVAGTIAMALAAIALTGFFGLVLYQRSSVYANLNMLSTVAESISRSVLFVDGKAQPFSTTRLRELEELTYSHVVFVGADGSLTHLTGVDVDSARPGAGSRKETLPYDALNTSHHNTIDRLLAGETIEDMRKMAVLEGQRGILVGLPVRGPSGQVGCAIILCRPLSSIQKNASMYLLPLAMSALLDVVISVFAAVYFARLVSSPVEHLAQVAERVRANAGEEVSVQGPLEIENLSGALRRFSVQLNQAIDSLASERSRLAQIVSGIGEGLVAVDTHGAIIYSNAAARELTGSAGPGLGEYGELAGLLQRTLDSAEQRATLWQLPDGRSVQATVYPILHGETQAVEGALALMRDVSESERLDQMRRDYIANISHELRTPLTGIRGMVEPLLDGVIDEEEEKQTSYRIIYQETVRLQKLIGDMLDMSRLQDGNAQLDLGPVEISSMLQAARQRLAGSAAEKGVSLEVDCPRQDIWCRGDEDRVMQVLIILLDNALRFTPTGGTITLFGHSDGERVSFGVSDTGCGIDPKDLPYIWERFFKADRSHSAKGGTGLGLSIAKLAVKLMEGDICVHSAPGCGARFTVRLKALDSPEA